jgi:DNA-binding transcriptional MerR regulator
MGMMREGPMFNLKAVVQQTGLKSDTLRDWERRYGLPSPTPDGRAACTGTRRTLAGVTN